jgi:hypothetical protein
MLTTLRKVVNFLTSHTSSSSLIETFRSKVDAKQDIPANYGYRGDLLDYFTSNNLVIHKWHHYIPLYGKYLKSFRNQHAIRFLEIGVSKGGSLQMWRKYFGDKAIIYGIDINPDCLCFDGSAAKVRIGSQSDSEFLRSIVNEMGGIDIVLDDGSHRMNDIRTTLKTLFPLLNSGGIYIIEDLHTAYWHEYGGGYSKKSNIFNMIRELIDDIHHWYHNNDQKHPLIANSLAGIHIHDSLVILQKHTACPTPPPVHSSYPKSH